MVCGPSREESVTYSSSGNGNARDPSGARSSAGLQAVRYSVSLYYYTLSPNGLIFFPHSLCHHSPSSLLSSTPPTPYRPLFSTQPCSPLLPSPLPPWLPLLMVRPCSLPLQHKTPNTARTLPSATLSQSFPSLTRSYAYTPINLFTAQLTINTVPMTQCQPSLLTVSDRLYPSVLICTPRMRETLGSLVRPPLDTFTHFSFPLAFAITSSFSLSVQRRNSSLLHLHPARSIPHQPL